MIDADDLYGSKEPEPSTPDDGIKEPGPEPTLEELMAKIRALSTKKRDIEQTLKGLKAQATRILKGI